MPRLTVDGIADDMLKAGELDDEAFYVARARTFRR
jgi:hypothetical protein